MLLGALLTAAISDGLVVGRGVITGRVETPAAGQLAEGTGGQGGTGGAAGTGGTGGSNGQNGTAGS